MKPIHLRMLVIVMTALNFSLSVYFFIEGYKDGKAAKQQKIQEQLKPKGGK